MLSIIHNMTQQFTITTVDSKKTGRIAWKLIITGTLTILLFAYWMEQVAYTLSIIPLVIVFTNYAINQSLSEMYINLTETELVVNDISYSYSSIERLNFDDDAVLTYLLRIHFRDKTSLDIHLHTAKKNLTQFNAFYELLKGKVNP
jgi:uncharacterized membrane protein YobD (UPF0266 family)